jgi:hypothetical protein
MFEFVLVQVKPKTMTFTRINNGACVRLIFEDFVLAKMNFHYDFILRVSNVAMIFLWANQSGSFQKNIYIYIYIYIYITFGKPM